LTLALAIIIIIIIIIIHEFHGDTSLETKLLGRNGNGVYPQAA